MTGIIWLASYPRSGNTWLRAFLANHFQNSQKPVRINDLPLFALGDNFLVHYEHVLGKAAADISDQEASKARAAVHQWLARTEERTVFVKTHNIVGEMNDQPLITPEVTAGAIYITRHPYDVAVSWAHHHQIDIDSAVEALSRSGHTLPRGDGLLTQHLGSWAEHVHSWTTAPGLTCHVMRYEDMQTRPRATFSALVNFLGLSSDQDRLKRAIRFSCFRELASQEKESGFVEAKTDGSSRFFREGRLGAGETELTNAQRDRLGDALGDVMRRYGYSEKGASSEWVNAS